METENTFWRRSMFLSTVFRMLIYVSETLAKLCPVIYNTCVHNVYLRKLGGNSCLINNSSN